MNDCDNIELVSSIRYKLVGVQLYAKKLIEIYWDMEDPYCDIYLVSVFLSITAPSS